MNGLRRSFVYTKSERVAIIILLCLIVIVIIWMAFGQNVKDDKPRSFHNLDSLLLSLNEAEAQQKLEAARADEYVAEIQLKPFPFNPNNMSEEDMRRLGLSERQIKNIKNYKAKGGVFYTKNDFKKLYTISEQEYAILEPYIVIPELSKSVEARSNHVKKKVGTFEDEVKHPKSKQIPVVQLNIVDSTTLLDLPGIGPYMASRILKYRDRLGGFSAMEQLREVKGMDSARYDKISPFVKLDSLRLRKLELNQDDFKTLLRHPYLDYELVKAIMNHRDYKGMILNWSQLQKVVQGKGQLNPRLEVYLSY
jgi:hypothetical protein